jgi:HEXXH motif-containing protein
MTANSGVRGLWDLNPESEYSHAVGGIRSLSEAGQPLTAELIEELAARGLYVRVTDPLCDMALQRAGALLHGVPPLERVVLKCVQDLLFLDAPDEWHDVSHSEPRWPNLIFVSLPPLTPIGDVRLAEAIVHEAMHLNLSLIESNAQLISDNRQLYSPWRLEYRPARGVLHGIYVFASLMSFFELLQLHKGPLPEQRVHLARRCEDILEECSQVDRSELQRSLTGDGLLIAQRIFESIDRRTIGRRS